MSGAGPLAGRSHGSPQHQGSPVRPRLMRTLAIYAAAVVALVAVFALYLQPGLMVMLAQQLWACF